MPSTSNAPGDRPPATPPTLTPAQQMLIEFVRDHDANCPICHYNVRALTRPICPECRHPLTLAVSVTNLHLGWLIAMLIPGFFSGIAACFVLVLIIARLHFGDGLLSPTMTITDAFGFASGIAALILAFPYRGRFLAQPHHRQRLITLGFWAIHIIALILLITIGPYFA